MTTAKKLLLYTILLLTGVIVFTGFVTVQMLDIVKLGMVSFDFTPLVGLISAIAGLVTTVLGYFFKSVKENTEGGITYLNALNDFTAPNEDGTVG